jgi:hypothetical protein
MYSFILICLYKKIILHKFLNEKTNNVVLEIQSHEYDTYKQKIRMRTDKFTKINPRKLVGLYYSITIFFSTVPSE